MMIILSTLPDSLRRSLLVGALLLLAVVIPGRTLAVPKTDIITLENGDLVTCEIKEMVRGKLTAKTDHMGTVYIEWDKIAKIQSTYWFLVSLRDGSLLYGQMETTDQEGLVSIAFQERSRDVKLGSIVEIQPVRYDLWNRFNMSASVGVNWDKASQVFQSNASASVKYNGSIYSWGLDLSANHTEQNEGTTRRNTLDLWLQREISGRFSGGAQTGVERNDELGLRRRISGGLNGGYFLSRSNHLELRAWLGANVNREWSTDESDPTNNAEGNIGVSFNMFYFDTPKSDISASVNVYPSFTVSDRLRFEGSVSGSQEIIKDLSLKLEYYESRDTKPPSGAGASSDRGIIFSIEWSK